MTPTPARYRSPLGRRPYDLRHAAVSLWLNSRVPATEVARRAGHDVAVLLKVYAHCIDGQSDAAIQRPVTGSTPGRESSLDELRSEALDRRYTVTLSTVMPRSASNSSTSR
jgi:hypothetical protein